MGRPGAAGVSRLPDCLAFPHSIGMGHCPRCRRLSNPRAACLALGSRARGGRQHVGGHGDRTSEWLVLLSRSPAKRFKLEQTLQRALAESRVAWVERAISEFGQRVPFARNIDLSALATDAVRNSATFLVTRSGGALRNTAGFFLGPGDCACRRSFYCGMRQPS